jgi:hypothetical protein
MRYIHPGSPPPPLPTPQPNAYRPPVGSLQDSGRNQHQPAPGSEVQPPPPQACAPAAHRVLLAAWRAHHGSDWVRADDLVSEVRRLIDDKDRTAAIRQKLRGLASTPIGGLMLEAKSVGNRAKPVMFYRVVESGPAGLEG